MGNYQFEILWIFINAFFAYLVYRIFKKNERPQTGMRLSLVVFLILTVDLFTNFLGVRLGVGFWLMVFILYSYISFGFYLVLKKVQTPKIGILLSISFFLLLVTFTFKEVYKDELFSKNNALEILMENKISLINDFVLVDNRSMSAIGDYYHLFRLEISNEDRDKLIDSIKSNPNFNNDTFLIRQIEARMNYQSNSIRILTYETDSLYTKMKVKASHYPRMASWLKISIHKYDNILIYEEFDE